MIIPKGCTVINEFTIPFVKDEIDVLYITYQQRGKTIIEKTLQDCIFNDGKVQITLTQKETMPFNDKHIIKVQIRIKLKNGVVTKSNVIEARTDEVLKKEVI